MRRRAVARLRLARGERRSGPGFTLIELLAVLLIMGLVAALTLPNLSLGADRAVLGEAEELASALGFARQRAVATALTHRLMLDLDQAAWWIEVEVEPPDVFAPAAPPPSAAQGAQRPLQLSAPSTLALGFAPLPGPLGRPRLLREPVVVDSVETLAAGSVRSGEIEIGFASDGTADPALIVLADDDGNAYTLHVARLADEIRIARE